MDEFHLPDGKLYAFVNSVERTGSEFVVEFDALTFDSMNKLRSYDRKDILFNTEIPMESFLVLLSANLGWLRKYLGTSSSMESMTDSWVEFELVDSGNFKKCSVFDQGATYADTPVPAKVKNLGLVSAEDQEFLSLIFNLSDFDEDWGLVNSEDGIKQMTDKYLNNVIYVISIGVGQGNANILCVNDSDGSSEEHIPSLCCFDVGGGFGWNWHTYRNSRSFPDEIGLIVLSHWDTDHFESAKRRVNEFMKTGATWIAPLQRSIGPRILQFARELIVNNVLSFFPPSVSSISSRRYTLFRCTGESRNGSGLGLRIESEVGKKTLIMGDAKGAELPTDISNTPVDNLVLGHHGAGQDLAGTPNVNERGNLILCHGIGNVYRHPHSTVVKELVANNRDGKIIDVTNNDFVHHDVREYEDWPCHPIWYLSRTSDMERWRLNCRPIL